jgi:hypothetical protein
MSVSSPAHGLVPVHIGQPVPGSEQEKGWRLPQRVPDELGWQKHGLEPRWLGMESSDCAVALQPGFYASGGASERDRFLAGAQRRGEIALVVAVIGDVTESGSHNPLSWYDSSVNLSDIGTNLNGRRAPAGSQTELVPGLSAADRDLALRLRTRPGGSPWWSLHLSGSHWERGDGSGSEHYEPQGRLEPILVDRLGEPVAAVWVPPSGMERWYIIPDATNWDTVLDWLMQQALPEYAPQALRRVRSSHFVDPDLQTADELAARQGLADLEAHYAEEKLHFERALHEAQTRAEPVRYGLLYATGAQLVQAVAQVLTDAGLRTLDLDQELGGTKSADLLVTADGPVWRLVEVKSASGAAPEQLVGDLQRHLTTWPQLRPEPVTGGVLIVNHQHRLPPSERTAEIYSRPEFVGSLTETVVSTVQLFNWWRAGERTTIRSTVLGTSTEGVAANQPQADSARPGKPPSERRRWRPGGRTQ